jgi:hypothetical protein
MSELIDIFAGRGDLAHLALFLWASGATALAGYALRELAAASRRFDDFVRELARFNNAMDPRSAPRHYVTRRVGDRHSEDDDGHLA